MLTNQKASDKQISFLNILRSSRKTVWKSNSKSKGHMNIKNCVKVCGLNFS